MLRSPISAQTTTRYFKPVRDRIARTFQKSNTSSPTSSHPLRLPPELWLEVLAYLSPSHVASVTLTCRYLRALSQPFLFRKISLRPFTETDILSLDRAGVIMSRNNTGVRKRLSRQLDFCLSPHIASAVQETCIIPSSSQMKRTKPLLDLLDTIFEALPKFSNLERLVCHRIPLNASRLLILRRLSLRSITLESCYSEDKSPYPYHDPIPIHTLSIQLSAKQQLSSDVQIHAVFLHPTSLRRLSAGPNSLVLPMIMSAGPLHGLWDLDVSTACITSPDFIPVLSLCSGIQRLTLRCPPQGCPRAPQPFPSDILPILSAYVGPRKYISHLAVGRPIQSLDVSPTCNPQKLMTTLSKLRGSSVGESLESLTVRVDYVDALLFDRVHSFFPRLRSLTIKHAFVESSQWLEFFSNTITPHSSLRTLRICVQMSRDPYNGTFWKPPEREVRDLVRFFTKLEPSLVQVYPRLRKVQVAYDRTGNWATLRRCSDVDNEPVSGVWQLGAFRVEFGTLTATSQKMVQSGPEDFPALRGLY